QSNPNFEEAFRPRPPQRRARIARLQKLGAVSESGAEEKIRDAFGPGSRDGREGALNCGLRALQLGTPPEQWGEGRLLIERRETFFQIADQASRPEEWIAENRAQLLPHLILAVLGHNQIQLRPLRLDLDGVRVRTVSLPDVEELFGDADGF